ncbi:MAG: hypothetical protein ACOYK9_04835 [Chlamydiia bacterium]
MKKQWFFTFCTLAFPVMGGASCLEAPKLSSPKVVEVSSDLLYATVAPILQQRLETIHYNRTIPVLQFIEHYKKAKKLDPSITLLNGFRTFPYQCTPEKNGGPCYVLSLDMLHHIPKEYSPYLALAVVPQKYQQLAFPQFVHTAVLIAFENREESGYLLLDPSFDFAQPILLKRGEGPVYYTNCHQEVSKFTLEGDEIFCEMQTGSKESIIVYSTKKVDNPIECSAAPMVLADRKLAIVTRDKNGNHKAQCSFELNKNQFNWSYQGVRQPPISFENLLKGELPPPFFIEALGQSQKEFNAMAIEILTETTLLDALYIEYLEYLYETKDTSVTGPLDFEQISKTLSLMSQNQELLYKK